MLCIPMPANFKIGDTFPVTINGKEANLTWRDSKTLVIEPDDAREIIDAWTSNRLQMFLCEEKE